MTTPALQSIVGELGARDQREMIEQIKGILCAAPWVRPETPSGKPMRVQVTNAGTWGWDGKAGYHYTRHQRNGNPWPPIPDDWVEIWRKLTRCRQRPDSAVINWYSPDAALGWHRDQSERDRTLPILTISLGDSCSWAMREDEGAPVSRARLETGAVTLLAGRTRSWLHTVERIIPAPLFSPLPKPGRISVTLRIAA